MIARRFVIPLGERGCRGSDRRFVLSFVGHANQAQPGVSTVGMISA